MSRRVQSTVTARLTSCTSLTYRARKLTRGRIPVQVVAAGINPGEIAIRNSALDAMFPAAFRSGQGSDFAGRVVETGQGVTEFAPGDEVLGWSDIRSAQADHILSDPVPCQNSFVAADVPFHVH